MFLFPSVAHVFRISHELQNPNLQCRYRYRNNSEFEIVSEELADYPF